MFIDIFDLLRNNLRVLVHISYHIDVIRSRSTKNSRYPRYGDTSFILPIY